MNVLLLCPHKKTKTKKHVINKQVQEALLQLFINHEIEK